MSSKEYVLLAYTVGLGLIWGYAVSLWISQRRSSHRS